MVNRFAWAGLLLAASFGSVAQQPSTPPPAASSAPSTLESQVETILADPMMSRAHWGIRVTTLEGTPVYSLNDGQFFQPASNNKLFTTAAAMALLGPEYTSQTSVVPEGPIAGGTLTGNLILRGGGDANLSATVLPYVSPALRPSPVAGAARPDPFGPLAELADRVAATGLKRVTGSVIGDDTLFPYEPYPEDWSIDDSVWYYGAPVSALTINDNALALTMRPGAKAGDPILYTLDPAMPWYTVDASDAVTGPAGSGSHLDVSRLPGSRTLRLFGTIATDAKPDNEDVAIDEPAEFAAKAFRKLLKDRGIRVEGEPGVQHRLPQAPIDFAAALQKPMNIASEGTLDRKHTRPAVAPLATRTSQPLGVDVVLTNKISQNLHAELDLHQLAVQYGDGSTVDGLRVVRSWLTQRVGIDPRDFVFVDGSGLSGHDLVTPRAITQLLRYAVTQPWGAAWKASLPVGGEDGSMRARFPDAPLKDHVFAKTGTLGEARALGGYIDCASGRTLIFSIMVNAHLPHNTDDMKAMDRIVAAIQATN